MSSPIDDTSSPQRIAELENELSRLREKLDGLSLAERQLRVVIENADLVLWALDRDGVFTLSEGRALSRLGLEPGEAVGRSVFELYATSPVILESSRRALEGEPFSGSFDLGDSCFAARYLPLFDDSGEPAGAIGVALDITERRQAEAALEQSESRFRQIAENIREVVWLFDLEKRRVTYVSPAYESIWGHPVERLYEEPERWADDVHPDDLERFNEFIEHLRANEGNRSLEVRVVRPDGGYRWVAFRGSTVQDETGRALRLVGTAEDVTEKKASDDERRRFETKVRQAQKLESLGVLAGGIAHDFNNLLMGVLGNADLAMLSMTPESPGHEYVQRIQIAAQRASELAGQMLAYSGKGRFVVGPVDLNRLVQEMLHLLDTVISKKIRLSVELADDLPSIDADASQIRQIVMNLVTNASEAVSPESGSVRISTSLFEADAPYLSQCEIGVGLVPGAYVRLEVSDTGPGIGEEIRKKIFDPFFTTKFTGRGLGLAAALGIVQSHGAALRVDSESGRGARFTMLFPPSPAPLESVRDTVSGSTPEELDADATILVVDDETVVRDVARAMLETAGYKVLVASDGAEASEIFRKASDDIDLVLLDMAMPGMDGRETFEALRKIREDIRIVLSSGYSEEETISRLGSSGVVDFVHKPYQMSTLLKAVREALSV